MSYSPTLPSVGRKFDDSPKLSNYKRKKHKKEIFINSKESIGDETDGTLSEGNSNIPGEIKKTKKTSKLKKLKKDKKQDDEEKPKKKKGTSVKKSKKEENNPEEDEKPQ